MVLQLVLVECLQTSSEALQSFLVHWPLNNHDDVQRQHWATKTERRLTRTVLFGTAYCLGSVWNTVTATEAKAAALCYGSNISGKDHIIFQEIRRTTAYLLCMYATASVPSVLELALL